ncbi:MAG: phosphatidylinositol-specific phospholipase C [Roseibacillus sp.]
MRKIALAFWFIASPLLRAEIPFGHEWLKEVSSKTPLVELRLPGTHNSAALFEPLLGTARCQSLTVRQQLDAGVRFLDIRCRHEEDGFLLYHGLIPQKQTFAELQETLISFLKENPSEFVLVSIQETSKPSQNSRSFEETARTYFSHRRSLWHLGSKLPDLGQVRGQAVLIRRFPARKLLGIDGTNWGHRGVHRSKRLLIQDRFQLSSGEEKWNLIAELWQDSLKHPNHLSLNFTSGYTKGKLGIPNITAISNRVNQRLLLHLSNTQMPPGILIMDFASLDLVSAVFSQNFNEPKSKCSD